MPAAARILTLADALVSQITTAWSEKGADDSVARCYIAPISTDDLTSLVGRQVYLFPGKYGNELATHGEDLWTYELGILIVERYTDAGDPTTDWMDARVDFAEEVMDAIDFNGRTLLAIGARRVWTEGIEIETYDLEMVNKTKIFWCELTATLKEVAA